MFPELPLLDDVERSCLARYLDLLVATLGAELEEVIVFGSVARGERWSAGMRRRRSRSNAPRSSWMRSTR